MKHIQLPNELANRVRKYHEFSWSKSHGLDQNTILKDLPDGIRDEIIENLVQEYTTIF
jgi:hypothetical protein